LEELIKFLYKTECVYANDVKKILKSSNTGRRIVVNGEGKIADTERKIYDAEFGLCRSV
jgi:hypothetical protein